MPGLPHSFRKVFERRACLIQELCTVGRARVSQARTPGLPAHAHPGVFEIFLLERGETQWWVEDEVHRIAAGNVYLNRPDERHGSMGASLKPCAYCWLQLAMSDAGLPGMSVAQSRRILRALSNPHVRIFSVSPAVAEYFVKLWEIHVCSGSDGALRARAYLHLLLADLTECMEKSAGNRHQTYAIRKVLQRIDSDPGGDHPVSKLAVLAALGRTQFIKRFLFETGFTPGDYVRRRRIELAKNRLRAGQASITTLAAELGFNSSQHFATVFKSMEGMKPSEFRREHKADVPSRGV
jgi:AraC-like DNA-binding protein